MLSGLLSGLLLRQRRRFAFRGIACLPSLASVLFCGLFCGLFTVLLAGLLPWLSLSVLVDLRLQLIGKVLQFALRSSQRFGFASQNRICGLLNALLQAINSLAGNLLCFLTLVEQSSTDQDFGRLECFLRFFLFGFSNCVKQPAGQQRFTFFSLFNDLLRFFKDPLKVISLLGYLLFKLITIAIAAERRSLLIVVRVVFRLRFSGEFSRCLLYTSPSPRDRTRSRMPSSA